jgi:hypothetical protein
MTSYERRFLAGEHDAVWRELRALSPVPAELGADVAAVARETMRRVARHVARMADALDGLGFVPSDRRVPVHGAPTDADRAEVDRLHAETGGLPYAFAACLREVGGVDFTGDCPPLELYYNTDRPARITEMPPGPDYPDPLVLPPVSYLDYQWDEQRGEYEDEDDDDEEDDEDDVDEDENDRFAFDFAPDELHKANISGSTHDLYLPDRSADPVLYGVAGRPGITLVEYLRLSVAWGGFPGWSFAPDRAPAALAGLRSVPDF